tara:strand:+ start:521 stop:1285 length:765 start_codon:yes stop_codon:yes gene_type:complete
MKVVILAGGFGTRLSEYTETIPKPMVSIGGKPIIWHIMNRYAKFGFNDFYIALGYKLEVIKDYFLKLNYYQNDISIDLNSKEINVYQKDGINWKVTLVNTGKNSMTGGRLKRMKDFIKDGPFMLTYGDGLSDINFNDQKIFHEKHNKMVTISAVHPIARFGELNLDGNFVKSFQEKPQLNQGWINGGFFICQPEFLDLINDDQTVLEKEPLEKVAKKGQLVAYRHEGFWQCMDTKRDKDHLENLWKKDNCPWLI